MPKITAQKEKEYLNENSSLALQHFSTQLPLISATAVWVTGGGSQENQELQKKWHPNKVSLPRKHKYKLS